jgi:hypothetical protein
MKVDNPLNVYEATVRANVGTGSLPNKLVALAWLQLVMEDVPHPDDWLAEDFYHLLSNPEYWGGWRRDLVREVFERFDPGTRGVDALQYAAFVAQLLKLAIPMIREFHDTGSLEDDNLLAACDVIQDFFNDVDEAKLIDVLAALHTLLIWHSDAPEDVSAHLETARDVLLFINTL